MQQPLALRPKHVPLQWDEAAAIVQTIAEHLADGRLDRVPPAEWLALDETGTLHIVESPGRPTAKAAAKPAAMLSALFEQLVGPNQVPAELSAALASASDGDSVAEFGRSIGFFVRPSMEKTFAQLFLRLRRHEEETSYQTGLEELIRKARSGEQHPTDQPSRPREQAPVGAPPLRTRTIVAAVAVALLVVAAALAGLKFRDRLADPAGTIAHEERAEQGPSGQQRSPARPSSGRTGEATDRDRPKAGALLPDSAPAEPLGSHPVPDTASIAWILSHRDETPSEDASTAADSAPNREALYDSKDVQVTPARLVQPRLPSLPRTGAPAAQLGRLELIVGTTGRVERVRLLSTTAERRYYDTMLLSAAKAWVFAPAERNGVPVRYRLEIALTN